MIIDFAKKNIIALTLTAILLMLVIVSLIMGIKWVAYINNNDIVAYTKSHDEQLNLGGLLISRSNRQSIEKCYNVFYDLLLKDPINQKRDTTVQIFQEYLNSILVEADTIANNLLSQKEITNEQEKLFLLVMEQAKRKNIQLTDLYKKHKTNEDELKSCLHKQAILRLAKNMLGEKQVNDEEAHKFYIDNQNQYITPPKVQAVIITLKNQDQAQIVWNDIKSGSDFFEVLVKYNKQFSLADNTLKLWVKKGQLDINLEKAIFDMEIGEKRGIVTTSEGYHIIKVENVVKSQLLEFEAVKDIVKADIKELYVISKWKEYITQLRAKTRIIVWR